MDGKTAAGTGHADGEAFKEAVKARHPAYSGENYLDMTTGFFFV